MKKIPRIALALFLISFAISAFAQPHGDISPGFKPRADGVIDIGPLFAEVNFYDTNWAIAQQHDKFLLTAPHANTPATQPVLPPGARRFSGILTTAQGPANLTETLTPADGGIDYFATLSSEKDLPTNELSVAFLLPTSRFANKSFTIDGDATPLPSDPAKKGEAMLATKDEAHDVALETPAGTLTIKGTFKLLLQDDREWGDPRYSLRLMFTPDSGSIQQSKIELQMRLKPTEQK